VKTKILLGITIALALTSIAEARVRKLSQRGPQSQPFDCPKSELLEDGTSVAGAIAEDLKRALLMGYMSSWQNDELADYAFRMIRIHSSEPGESVGAKYKKVPSDKSVVLRRVEDITPAALQKEDPHSTYRAYYDVTIGKEKVTWEFSFIRHKGMGEFSGGGCGDILYLPSILLHAATVAPY
jgi:hypothetical protein